MDDGSDLHIVATVLSRDAIESALSLLQMGAAADDETQRSSAASSAVIAALAHLARSVEMSLVATEARSQGSEGGEPVRGDIERRLPVSLFARMRQLASDVHGPDFELDESKPMVRLLRKAIGLRNALVHEPGTYAIGTAKDLGAEAVDGSVTLSLATPPSEWREVSIEYAQSVVDAVEAFEDAMIMWQPEGTPPDSRFLVSVTGRRGTY